MQCTCDMYMYHVICTCIFIELLVLGTGTKMVPMEIGIRRYLQSKGISIEIQDTVRYCSL